jgi:hypothetical protein
MNKIKSLLRNIKARIVSFFKAPYHKLYQSLWDSIHDQTVCLVSDKLENDQDFLDLEEDVKNIKDDKLNIDDFDYELSQAYSFTELDEKVDELESLCEADPFQDIEDEDHPVSKLFDERTNQIHSLILEVKGRLDKQSDKDSIADLAIKIVDGFRLAGLCPLDDGEDETHFEYQDIIRTHLETYLHSNG